MLLKDVLYVPGFLKNIVSLTKMVSGGVNIHLGKDNVKFEQGGKTIEMPKGRDDGMWYMKSNVSTPHNA